MDRVDPLPPAYPMQPMDRDQRRRPSLTYGDSGVFWYMVGWEHIKRPGDSERALKSEKTGDCG